jgi:putative tryptophan/tyrosine transport system substrate-binding protein
VRRREFISVLCGAVFACPLSARAQQSGVHRIGTLGGEDGAVWDAFRLELRRLGYIQGGNITIEPRWSGGVTERYPALARELVGLNVDVIVASGTQAVQAAMQATRTIPIVMALSAYPERSGLIQSLARPGGNVTGLSTLGPELAGKRLELLKEMAPRTSRVAFLFNPANAAESIWLQEVLAAAPAVGVNILPIALRSPKEHSAVFAAAASQSADALLVVGNPVTFSARQLIVETAAARRLPAIYEERLFVEAGGLMSYAPNFSDLFRQAAAYVDKVLKGSNPAELPVEQPTRFELVINVKTARALGLNVPASLIARAEVID